MDMDTHTPSHGQVLHIGGAEVGGYQQSVESGDKKDVAATGLGAKHRLNFLP